MDRSPIPVTLLSGFLGSGKTTLLRHILTSPDTSLRIAVVVNDMAALNIDAALVKKHIVSQASEEDKLIQLQNGCICCTLRGDLLEAMVKMARDGQADYIVIESTGISEPMQVAETFTTEFAMAMIEAANENTDDGENEMQLDAEGAKVLKDIAELGGLHKIVKLDTLITMVDAYNFFNNFSTTDFITDRWGKEGVAPEDERTVTDLMVDQIEFANTVIINKIDSVDDDRKKQIRGVIKKLNPEARIIEAAYAKVDVKEVLATSSFDFEKAATGMGWLQSLHEMSKREINGRIKIGPKPETEEYGISSFVYQARKPFHPKRLYQLIHDKFVLMENQEDDEDKEGDDDDDDEQMAEEHGLSSDSGSAEDETMSDAESWQSASDSGEEGEKDLSQGIDPKIVAENKLKSPVFRGLLRSKGFFWLATRPTLHGAWSQAGTMLTLQGGEQWFCTLDESEWPEGEATRESILRDFKEPWGDRRQEIVFIGQKVDQKALSKEFDKCLLNVVEMKRWQRIMTSGKSMERIQQKLEAAFEDGFEDWPEPESHADSAGHDHHTHR